MHANARWCALALGVAVVSGLTAPIRAQDPTSAQNPSGKPASPPPSERPSPQPTQSAGQGSPQLSREPRLPEHPFTEKPVTEKPAAERHAAERHGRPRPRNPPGPRTGYDADSPTASLEWVWPEFGVGDWIATGTGAVTTIVARVIGPNEGNIRRGGVLLDEKVRDALRVKSRRGQFRARDASDFFLAVTVAYPFLIDSLALAYFRHDSEEVAVQMALINAEATVVSTALQTIANAVASRERPYGRLCGNDLDAGINDCIGRNRFRSFFSGHTSQSFMSAALTCSHHMNLPLLGGGPVEHTPCVVGFAFAAAAGLGRIMGDVHYWSDVMTGAISGAAVGFLVPWLHYRSELDLGGDPRSNVQWQVVPNGLGASVVGSF